MMSELEKNLEKINQKSSLSPRRNIEKYYKKILDNTFWKLLPLIEDKTFKEEVEKNTDNILQIFNSAYWIVKEKFKYTERDSWERALNHMIWVADEYIKNFSKVEEKLKKIKLEKETWKQEAILIILNEIDIIITAFFHDIIEDTDISFEWLKTMIWEKNAFCVLLLTKEPFCNFIEDKRELEDINKMKEIWLLNKKWELSDNYKRKEYIQNNEISEIEKIIIFWEKYDRIKDEEDALKEEKELYEKYKILKQKYKWQRNKAYFWHINSLVNFLHFSKDLFEKIELSEPEKQNIIKNNTLIVKNAIYVKIADRINNLSDILNSGEKWTFERIEKKLIETEESILKIAKEIVPEAYKILKKMIAEIRKNINKRKIDETTNETKEKIWKNLKK